MISRRSIIRLLTLLLLPLVATAVADEKTFAKWEKEIAAFEAADRESPPPKGAILFIGSSSIRMWETLAKDFPEHRVINRGFGGSQIVDATQFADRIVIPYAPRQIILYSGGNDINAGKSPEQVLADLEAFVAKVRSALPETEIAYIAIAGNPARWTQVEKVEEANALIERFTREQPRLKFIDVFPHMLGTDGLPRPEIFVEDRLHMNAEGYKLWRELIRPHLSAEPSR